MTGRILAALRRRTPPWLASLPAAWLRIALAATTFLAFSLLLANLDGQSMWNDEGLSVVRARQPLATILSNTITIDGVDTRDTNPPLYFLFLAGWRVLAGESVFALRAFGVLAAVLNIPMIYQVARLPAGRRVGFAAACLLAISPFHVWQSQELRNYSLLLLFNLLSVYGLFRFLLRPNGRGRWRWLLLWAFTAAAGLYTHYFGAFVFAFGLVALLFWAAGRPRWRPSPALVVGMLVVGLATLPVLIAGLRRFQAGRQVDFVFVPLDHLLTQAISAFGVGIIHGYVQPWWRIAPAAALFAMGILFLWRSRQGRSLLLLVAYLLIPFLLLVGLSLVNPIYNGPRHLYPSFPPFLILVAAGLVLPWSRLGRLGRFKRPARWLGVGLGLWLVVSQLSWLDAQYHSEALVKDDLRGLADYLERVAREDDLIVLHDTIVGLTFDYYYQGDAPWIAAPLMGQTDPQAAIDRLVSHSRDARRVWFVSGPAPRTGFPPAALSDWIHGNWPFLASRRFPSFFLGLNSDLYVPQPRLETLPAAATQIQATWDGGLTLNGIEIPATITAASQWQPVFYWSRPPVVSGEFELSLSLVDEGGVVWNQADIPLWNAFPPGDWPPGTIIRFPPLVDLPAGVPPGIYQLRLRLIPAGDTRPLSVNGQPTLPLGELSVAAALAPGGNAYLPEYQPVRGRFGGQVELVGFHRPAGDYRPGHIVPIELYWRVLRPPSAELRLRVQLRDGAGRVVAEQLTAPTRAAYPSQRWQAGELLKGQAEPLIPADAEAGPLEVTVALVDEESGRPLRVGWFLGPTSLSLGDVPVTPWPLVTELPPISRPLQADLGQPALARLHGYDLSPETARPGEALELTLYWRSLTGAMTTSYTVFVHLLDDDDTIVGQGDDLPLHGFRPTTSWRDGEVIVDPHTIPIKADTPAGVYRLWIGLYDSQTDMRLPVFSGGALLPNGRLPLTTVTVVP